MEDDYELTISPLSQTMTRNGRTFRVEIYRGPDTGWSLEVVNEADTSIVWNDEFPTDQEAFDEIAALGDDEIDAMLDNE